MIHYQITAPEKAAVSIDGFIVITETLIKNMYIVKMVLDVYKRPFDPLNPVICMDESPKQLIAETKIPIPCSSGKTARYDYEYKRCGVGYISCL